MVDNKNIILADNFPKNICQLLQLYVPPIRAPNGVLLCDENRIRDIDLAVCVCTVCGWCVMGEGRGMF